VDLEKRNQIAAWPVGPVLASMDCAGWFIVFILSCPSNLALVIIFEYRDFFACENSFADKASRRANLFLLVP
jgi:hypothetical protein